MTNIDVKTVGGLSRSVGPTEEHRQEFGQPPLGSLLARAVVWVAVTAALVLTHPFQILPTLRRATVVEMRRFSIP